MDLQANRPPPQKKKTVKDLLGLLNNIRFQGKWSKQMSIKFEQNKNANVQIVY